MIDSHPSAAPPAVGGLQLSIIIPAFNEAESLVPLCQELGEVIEQRQYRAEVIIVDDGSRDGSHALYPQLCGQHPWLRVLLLRRNFGQTAAMMAGIRAARGAVLVPMDADLQNDPHDIPRLLDKIGEGYQVVSGWRRERQDRLFSRRLPSFVANKLIAWISGVPLHDLGCTLKAYRSETLEDVVLYGEMHRFIPIYASWEGGRVAELAVHHRARRFGRSKYGLNRTLKVVLDLVTVKFLGGYAQKPIHFFGIPGIMMGLVGFALASYLSLRKLFFGMELSRSPMLLLAILLLLLGFMNVMLGVLAEVMVRTYHESQGKFTYRVAEELGAGVDDPSAPRGEPVAPSPSPSATSAPEAAAAIASRTPPPA
ncbi:MAG: glycosyltransferase family 2 protein [Proteobacteria bacterium]|nr:glycosyltransferase family 2 protein [Pseudomonadota bacterium]